MNSSDAGDGLVRKLLSHLEPPIKIVDSDPSSLVAQFYAGRCVFITGATGFIGKGLIEKLVRSCAGVRKIYVLVREKHGKGIQDRLTALIKSQCFDRLREIHGGSDQLLKEKLFAIKGDITLPQFGISPDDMRLLASEVSVVLNSAATVRFVEPLENAVRNNIYSVGQLVEVCNQLTQLEALVHMSTAYTHCQKLDRIHEIFYEPPMRGDEILDALKQICAIQDKIRVPQECGDEESNDEDHEDDLSDCPPPGPCKLQRFFYDGRLVPKGEPPTAKDLLVEFTRVALRRSNRPNTYTFTKAISESYLLEKLKARPDRYLDSKIPVAIIRPSIVGAAWREPIVGLVDNFNGPTGAMMSLYTGTLQAMPGNGNRKADMVPVDMVINMVLCTGWFLIEQKRRDLSEGQLKSTQSQLGIKKDNGVYVFNYVSGNRNALRWGQVTDVIAEMAYKYPSNLTVRLPSSFFLRGGILYDLYDAVNQKLPAYLLDVFNSKVLGKDVSGKLGAMSTYARVRSMTETLTSFTSTQWEFCDRNVRLLFDTLTPIDKAMFHFEITSLSWPDYLRSYIVGSRIYTLKDDAKSVTKSLAMIKRRRILQGATIATLMLMFYCCFIAGGQLDIFKMFLGF